jgi:hypothetical protein
VSRVKRREPERAREVLAYFVRHPQAADSLEGVARWRLLEETIYRRVEEVEEALRWLVERGFLAEESAVFGPAQFRLNPKSSAKAARFLGGSKRAECR